MYNFNTQLQIGEYFEAKIDSWLLSTSLKQFESIYKVSLAEQRLGIDRFALDCHGFKHSLEYKTDLKAHVTENLFLETRVGNKPGWIHKCIANEIYVYVPMRGELLQFTMEGIRKLLLDHSNQKELPVRNEGYVGKGIVVPLKKAKSYTVNTYYRKSLLVTVEEYEAYRRGVL